MGIIDWANSNEGFAFVLLTSIYVIATIIIVLVMLRSNSIQLRQITLLKDIEEERSRPLVIFYLNFSKRNTHVVDAVIRNIGESPAYDIKISILPEMRRFWNSGIKDLNPVEEGFQFLPPGEKIIDSLGMVSNFHKVYEGVVFKIKIEYRSASGKSYSSEHNLNYDYRTRIGPANVSKKDIGNILEKMEKSIGEIASKISNK